MSQAVWMLAVGMMAQVPAPGAAAELSAHLRQEFRAIRERETSRLGTLADDLAAGGEADASEAVRALIEPAPPSDGPTRFVPLPEVIAPAAGLANVPAGGKATGAAKPEARAIRASAAEDWFKLAEQALRAGQFALADECLRQVVARQPDHAEARRLLGYVRHEGGWATPFAVRLLREGHVYHPTFGWVPAAWIPHLDQGELPAPSEPGRPLRWLPAAEADALRRDFAAAWQIDTPHFKIRANVPLAEAITFGRRLEDFHEAFLALMADVIGPERLPLALRYRRPTATSVGEPGPHHVWYFATKDEFVEYLRDRQGPGIEESLGLYLPAKVARGRREPPTSYFYKDLEGQLDVAETLYHEVSHQLLFETAGPTGYERNAGNFWVFEGLGTYFETVSPQPDDALEIGGLVGPRVAHAELRLVERQEFVPIARLVAMDKAAFNDGDVYLHYAESMALTIFLMQADQGRYREGFLAYVHDAYRGRARGTQALADHLGQRYETLDERFLEFLKAGAARRRPG